MTIDAFLSRNVADVIVVKKLKELLESDEKITVYLGVDPSGPVIHLGHAVALWKLRELQEMGHQIILLIGDFTGQIGDPTGKDAARKPLTHDEVLANAESYKTQASKILDFDSSENPAEIRFNAEWLSRLDFSDLIKFASHFTVQQMLERDMFEKRMNEEKPISLHEFFYPLMQGYDSVALKADLEVGGTDQTFNMLAGRTLRKAIDGVEKHVLTVPLLVGTDGRKMSKSYNNDIGITDPANDMFGKLMSIRDELIIEYFTLCTRLSDEEIATIKQSLESGANPRDIKAQLAREVATLYHSEEEALKAEKEFEQVFKSKGVPTDMPEFSIEDGSTLFEIFTLVKNELDSVSNSEFKRLAKQGAVKVDDTKITDPYAEVSLSNEGVILRIGKLNFFKITKK